MKTIKTDESSKIFFLDNIRWMLAILVLILHAAASYSNIEKWTVSDSTSFFFDYILKILGTFLMPMFFLIGGYFTLPSLRKHGAGNFIKNKLIRLGIPWLVGVIFICPVIIYIRNYSHHFFKYNMWDIFIHNLKSILLFQTGKLNFMQFLPQHQFDQNYFWFISLLFFFFLIAAAIYEIITKNYKKKISSGDSGSSSGNSIIPAFLITIISVSICGFFIEFANNFIDEWVVVAGFLQIQFSRITLYIGCFCLGMYAFSKKCFIKKDLYGSFIYWLLVSAALCSGFILFEKYGHYDGSLFSLGAIFINTMVRVGLTFSVLLTIISFSITYLNKSTSISRLFSPHSYNIYLLHMIPVVMFQFIMLHFSQISVFIKFIIVTAFSLFFTFLLSRYIFKPFSLLAKLTRKAER